MGLMGTGVQSFTDNFLKTYMAIGEDRRAEEGQKIARQMAEEKLAEIAQEQKMRDAMAAYQSGLMNPALGQQQAPIQQNLSNYNFMGGQGLQVDQGLLSQPTQQTYSNQMEAWKAAGKDPLYESMLGQADILSRFDPKSGINAKASLYNAEEGRKTREALSGVQQQNFRDNMELRLKIAEMNDNTKRRGQDINITVGDKGMSYGDKIAIKDRYKSLSKAETKAQDSIFKIEQYDTLIDSLKKGDVGGFEGGVKAFLAPVAESLGIDTNGKMGEAQAFKLMSRALIGDMRLDLVGSGPVSDAEQKLLSKLSGGDINVSRAAAKELFTIYRSRAANNIKQYHGQYDLLSKRYPDIKGTFMRFDDVLGKNQEQPQNSRDISIGVSYLKTAKNRDDAKARIRALSQKGWTNDELNQMASQAGF